MEKIRGVEVVRVPHECSINKRIKAFVSVGDNAKLYRLGLFPLRCPYCGHMMKPNIMKEAQDEHDS